MKSIHVLVTAFGLSLVACGERDTSASSNTSDMVAVCIRYNGGEEPCKRKYGAQSSSQEWFQQAQSTPATSDSSALGLALAAAAESAAARRGTVGYCYGGVADAMDMALATSVSTWSDYGIGASYAYQFADWANANPNDLASVFGLRRDHVSASSAPVGSVFAYEPGHCGMSARAGHIEVKTEQGRACSDHCRAYSCEPSYVFVPAR